MEIGGTIVSSLEYSGKMSLVIFMAKCPLRCPYCHNGEILEKGNEISLEEIFKIIDDSKKYIDAIVISGGEPLVQLEDTIEILKYAKSLNLKTKVDTSGNYPKKLEKALKYIDYLAIDVKAPFDDYKKVIGANIGKKVKKSIEIANTSESFLECRTTYVPTLLNHEDIKKIASEISCDLYTLQQFRNKNVLDESLKDVESPNPIELKILANELHGILDTKIKVKTTEFGEECI